MKPGSLASLSSDLLKQGGRGVLNLALFFLPAPGGMTINCLFELKHCERTWCFKQRFNKFFFNSCYKGKLFVKPLLPTSLWSKLNSWQKDILTLELLNKICVAQVKDRLNDRQSHWISLAEQHIFPSGSEREKKPTTTVSTAPVFPKAHWVPLSWLQRNSPA